jgi:hypothetical protein
VGLHCRAGIGRSGLMAAGLLMFLGEQETVAWDRVSKARGLSLPDTQEQRFWPGNVIRASGLMCS